ncbi:MAG: GNAT family N-acetyltransferase [Flavobacteriaceae bacterium]|nr:GNAT family N-acetyltransferase [Flavobacteriaceae bacterium]
MELLNNPFTSPTYTSTWQKHFRKDQEMFRFESIKDLTFFRNIKNGLYINLGTVKTLGINYQLDSQATFEDIRHKTFLVYDVPDYATRENTHPNLGIKSISQYAGYRVDTAVFEDLEDYIVKTLSKNRRKSFMKAWRKLEREHDIRYKVFYGEIDKDTYRQLFDKLHHMMATQYEEKSEINYHMSDRTQNWHFELFYKLINEKKASFNVIYNEETPIAISINYHSDDIFFAPFGCYDQKYLKYGIGNIQMMKELSWVFENKDCRYYDLGKASYGYKQRWANQKYYYNYHILYDKKSVKANFCALSVYLYFKGKSVLRVWYYKLKSLRKK